MENETEREFPFSTEDTARLVCEAVLEAEGCPYEAQVNVLLTDDRGIREMNREYRGIDRETDIGEDSEADYFDPETGELVLGDIMISVDRVYGQAEEYGHSVRREFAFLVAHSMLHLCGYDHMEEEERARMERRQEEILTGLGITRD